MESRAKLNLYDIKIFKCGIISDLLEGKEPKKAHYISKDELTEEEFSEIIGEMFNERLILSLLPANDTHNKRFVNWWNEIEVTTRGIVFQTNFMNGL